MVLLGSALCSASVETTPLATEGGPWYGPGVPSRSLSRRQLRCRASSDDLYSILSVPATASQAEIKAAYRRLVQDLHPDKHAHKQGQADTAEAFLKCKLAYEVLSDAEQRMQYDQALAGAGGSPAGQGPPSAQAWSPYNGWMDAYSASSAQHGTAQADSTQQSAGQHTADYYQTLQEAATATAAAGANSSGLSDYKDPSASALSGNNDASAGAGSLQEQQVLAAVRAALLDEHGLALEQFGSLQDALAALAEREQQHTVVGLAEEDYDTDWQL